MKIENSMRKSSKVLKSGSRVSNLALIQSEDALKKLGNIFTSLNFKLIPYSSPGDRDKKMNLIESPANFFTKDLDDAILNGDLDCAIHSAKDMPYPVQDGLDWFWLPWREDPRDAYILQRGKTLSLLPENPIIGVSSERRNNWSKTQFSKAIHKPIRGNIEERISQLDNGDFDLLIMATAALNRLNLQDRISGYISEKELPPPEGQGYLSITFRKNDNRFKDMRSLFISSVTFTGAGCGRASLCTLEGIDSLKNCDVCLYDSLIDDDLLKYVPSSAQKIFVGKRSGSHSTSQKNICELLGYYARQGKKITRLKGGDPALFGRLKEEIGFLDNYAIPYKIIPGISALLGATGPAGILLTQRGLSNGFTVITPGREDISKPQFDKNTLSNLPIVLFMAVEACKKVIEELKNNGIDTKTPASMIFNGGHYDEEKIFATIDTIIDKLKEVDQNKRPGLLIIGNTAFNAFEKKKGALSGKKVLITCSDTIKNKGVNAVHNYGGNPIPYPLIELKENGNVESIIEKLDHYNYLILSSPTVINIFFSAIKKHSIDIRNVPPIVVSGKESEKFLGEYLIKPFGVANAKDAGSSIVDIFKNIPTENKILRIGSSKCGSKLSSNLENKGFDVDEIHICDNQMVLYNSLPSFDAVIFSSGSAIESFITQFGRIELIGKVISLLGTPSKKVLKKYNLNNVTLMSDEHSVEGQVKSLASYYINKKLEKYYE